MYAGSLVCYTGDTHGTQTLRLCRVGLPLLVQSSYELLDQQQIVIGYAEAWSIP